MVDYEARSMPEIIEHQNRETLSVVQFETVRAVERADELLSLKGLDVVDDRAGRPLHLPRNSRPVR